jgi:outer membrane receptor protein involved in Fe transport
MRKPILSFSAAFLAVATTAYGQAVAGFGGISGVLTDASGAVVPGAQVVVSNEAKGLRRSLVSNEAGVFTAPALVPAPGYSVSATKAGFSAFEAKNVEVLVGQDVNLKITLGVAATTTEVQVTDSAPVVESTKTGISNVVNSSQIMNLPINGRRVDSFVLFSPAVVPDGTFGLISFRGIAGGNNFLTDGNDTTNAFYNENGGRTRISSPISQDTVQEFQVLSNGFSAEYGRASGGVINTVTRSGGNDVHGTGYWFFRNQDFNATDLFSSLDPATNKRLNPVERRDQFGGSVGGKIVRDKLFYFFNGEATRRNFPLIASLTRPPLFDANGNFVAQCGATPQQCDAALKWIKDRHFRTVDRRADQELAFLKLDYRPTERHAVSLSFNYLRWISPNGLQSQAVLNNGNGVGNNADSTVRTRYGRASWTWIPTNNIVNEVRYGWFKDRLFDDANPAFITPETGRIQLTVQNQTNLGVADAYPRLNPSENRNQVADNLTWTKGKHTWKFGGDIMHTQDYNVIMRNRNGTYTYPTFTAFAQDFTGNTTGAKRWQTFSQRFGTPQADTRMLDFSIYVQDQFRVTQALTLNYGLRYEYTSFSQPAVVNPDYPKETGRIPEPGKNFAPRIGIVYNFNRGRTVLRAGYGIFFARFQGGMINTFFLENGVYQKQISLNSAVPADLALGPVFPRVLPGIDRNPPAGTIDITFPADSFRNPYTQQGDVGIEHEITKNLGITVSYLWSRGVQLTTVRDLNIGPLGPDVTYRVLDSNNNQVGTYTTPTYRLANRIDPRWRRINQVENGGRTYYDALVVQMRKRFSKTWEGSASYTWSHAIDFNQGAGNDNIFFSSGPRSLRNGNYSGDKSSSTFDVRHRLVFTGIFQPTFMKSNKAAAKYLVNNWQFSVIGTLASAAPATPTVFVSGSPFAGAAMTGTLNGFGGSSRVPFWPAASLPIDQIYRADARIAKLIPIREHMQLQLNFEAFNLTNSIYFTSVNGQAFTAANGALTPTPRLGEGSASQGFPDGTNARRLQFSMRFVF